MSRKRESELFAGVAAADITPPVGVDLCGYGSRSGPSAGVLDSLAATALYLRHRDTALLIIGCDLIGLHHDQVAALRRDIGRRAGIPAGNILVGCSHTHAGPATPCIRWLGRPDRAYLQHLHETLCRTAVAARTAARPAVVGRDRVRVNIGVNRRERRAGKTMIGINPGGTVPTCADLLAVRGRDGRPVALLYVHAAHAVALGADNRLISADWPGVVRRELRRRFGAEFGVVFLQGCCGDINCAERGAEGMDAMGRRLAAALSAAWDGLDDFEPNPSLGGVIEALELPLQPPPDPAVARRLHDEAGQRLAALPVDANRGIRWMAEGAVAWAAAVLELAEKGAVPERRVPFHVQALRIGDIAVVGLPGEVFFEYALAIAAASPFEFTAVAGYANGNVGYIPTAAACAEGGYEVCEAIRYYGTTMPVPESESLIRAAAAAALGRLRTPRR